ncbi:MAG: ABC transporter permease [Saprospiraceae bacterium]|nr:ABC transporter permease [Saprospiraceae bacterium]
MLNHYLTIVKRIIFRQRAYFLINTAGLVLGLTAVLLAFVFISDESSYDAFHSKADRIVRANKWVKAPTGERDNTAETPGMMAAALETDFPEVEVAAHFAPWFDPVLLSKEERNLEVENFAFADAKFFEIFDFELQSGNAKEALNAPGQALLTPKVAQALFGNEDPIGKTFLGIEDKTFTVTGIIEEAPRRSHIQYDVIASWASTTPESGFLDFSFMNNWLGQTVYTYALLSENADIAALDKKMPDFVKRYMSNRTDSYSFYFQPLQEVYLHNYDIRFLRGMKAGSAPFVRMFMIIASLILVIACFNYVNISTAKSLSRAKEVGVKKVMGARRSNLFAQFLSETTVFVSISALLALGLAYYILPVFNQVFARAIPQALLVTPGTLAFLSGTIAITSLFAGFYPGMVLSRFRPITVLRSNSKTGGANPLPRQILTTGQLTLSVALIASTLILNRQFDYFMNKDLGFDREQVLMMSTPPGILANLDAYRNTLKAIPGIESVSICQAGAGPGTFGSTVFPEGSDGKEVSIQIFRVDTAFLETYGMEMAEGRYFSPDLVTDQEALIVNEAMVQQMGWENPLERTIQFSEGGPKIPIIGVVKDFHFNSFHQAISPLMMYLDARKSNISVRVDQKNVAATIQALAAAWKQFEPRYPFKYEFVDEHFASQYAAEQRSSRIFIVFSIVAIFIACLGLYGLTAFNISQRVKEIGIRKVLGASVGSIVMLFHKRLIYLTIIAFVLATPIAYYFTAQWLERFAYTAKMGWSIYLFAGIVTLLVASVAVLAQSIRAAVANPVESLRSE